MPWFFQHGFHGRPLPLVISAKIRFTQNLPGQPFQILLVRRCDELRDARVVVYGVERLAPAHGSDRVRLLQLNRQQEMMTRQMLDLDESIRYEARESAFVGI